ncbi:peptidase S1 [Rhodobacterales bacterium HKCCE3408]|nr:peptidase S1 [Rhodobacterales bacterium HKCCE3408]
MFSAPAAGVLLAVALLSAGTAGACPSYNNPTVFGSANIQANFQPDPYIRNVTAGGTTDLAGCTPFLGPGFVVNRPDFRFQYSGTSPTGRLTIALQATSNVDTILVVNAPDGSWFYNDDYNGSTNSAIVFVNPLPGQYDVWTGSYYLSSNNPAQLIITELAY